MPASIVKWNKIQYWFWLVLNTTNTLFFSVFAYYLTRETYITQNTEGAYKVLRYYSYTFFSDCLLKIVFGSYMAYAIYRVKRIINQHEILNTKILTLHTASFAVYMLSTIINVLFIGLYAEGLISLNLTLIAGLFKLICSVITQLIMSYIFRSLEEKKGKLKELAERVRPRTVV